MTVVIALHSNPIQPVTTCDNLTHYITLLDVTTIRSSVSLLSLCMFNDVSICILLVVDDARFLLRVVVMLLLGGRDDDDRCMVYSYLEQI